ncbi:MAG: tyrosine-type recombinase/integrase [Candidatus Dormibacteraeota bacterium]|jgi:integrase|nr:tyrosine-type recombinase/integrase [Candidatus Dormibacteraeota bacterium]
MTRRGNREGSIRQRPGGLWEAQLLLQGRRRSVYGRTRQDVLEKLRQLQAGASAGLPVTPARLTTGDYLSRWLQQVEPRLRPRTVQHYRYMVRLLTGPEAGIARVRLAQLQPDQVEQALARLQTSGLSPRTCWHARNVLRCALGDAIRWRVLAQNAAQIADAPRIAHQPPRILTPEEALAVIAAMTDPDLRRLVGIALWTGLRQGELLGLRWPDVDLIGAEVHVTAALQRVEGEYRLVEVKSASSRRTVPLTEAAVTALEEQRHWQVEARLAAGGRWREPIPGLVFTTSTGSPRSASAITHAFARALSAAGLPPMHWHHLRHGFAGLLLATGSDLATVSGLLGHTSVALTASTYAGVAPSLKRQAADRLGLLLERRPG